MNNLIKINEQTKNLIVIYLVLFCLVININDSFMSYIYHFQYGIDLFILFCLTLFDWWWKKMVESFFFSLITTFISSFVNEYSHRHQHHRLIIYHPSNNNNKRIDIKTPMLLNVRIFILVSRNKKNSNNTDRSWHIISRKKHEKTILWWVKNKPDWKKQKKKFGIMVEYNECLYFTRM